MKVVSNTSPICYLYLINHIEILPNLFGDIYIPEAVYNELQDRSAPLELQRWIRQPPSWLNINEVNISSDSNLFRLHAGERDAIYLAKEIAADLILLDEKAARNIALEKGLRVAGLVGVLDKAATKKMINLKEAVEKLIRTNFRISPQILSNLLNKHYGNK